MEDRRVLALLAAVLGSVVLIGIGFGVGRASKSGNDRSARNGAPGPVLAVDGVPVGVSPTRAGALAAADNYAAMATETVIQSPRRYERLVRTAYSPSYQATALREGREARTNAPGSVRLYSAGGKTLVIVAARRLDAFRGTRATVTSWVGGFTWGPHRNPGQNWSLVEMDLRWDGQRWRIDRLDAADRPAPSPTTVALSEHSEATNDTFDRELRAMTAPIYGSD